MSLSALAPPKLFRGWYQVLIFAWVLGVGSTTIQFSVGFLIDPITQEFGWSLTALAAAISLRAQSSAIAAPVIGYSIDRFGSRWTLAGGLVLFAGSLLWLSTINSIWAFYGSFMLLSVGNSAIAGQTASVNIARWFVRQRGRAMLLVYLGPGIASLTIPIYATIMAEHGWRAGQVSWAVVVLLFCLPLTLLIRESPEEAGLLPDGATMEGAAPGGGAHSAAAIRQRAQDLRGASLTTKQALRSGLFWRLALAFTLTSMSAGPVLALMVPSMTNQGVSREAATFANAAFPFVLAALRLVMARWGDSLERRNLMIGCYLAQVLGTVVIAMISPALVFLVIPFLLLFGTGFGIPVPLRSTLTADYFGVNSMGTIQGILQFLTTIGGVIGPLFVGRMVDETGTYRWPFLMLAAITACAVPLMLTLPKVYPRRPAGTPAPAGAR